MIRCPKCHCPDCPVVKTYPRAVMRFRGKLLENIKRARRCRACGHGFYTVERGENDIVRDEDPPKRRGDGENPFL